MRGSPLAKKRAGEPKAPGDRPEPPAHLDPVALEIWQDTTAVLERMGILSVADATALGIYASKWSRLRAAQEFIDKHGLAYIVPGKDGKPKGVNIYPLVWLVNKLENEIIQIGRQFGLTPVARSAIAASTEPDDATAAYFKTR